jgi:hypothetical protein
MTIFLAGTIELHHKQVNFGKLFITVSLVVFTAIYAGAAFFAISRCNAMLLTLETTCSCRHGSCGRQYLATIARAQLAGNP